MKNCPAELIKFVLNLSALGDYYAVITIRYTQMVILPWRNKIE